jgi:hypothetical protein
MIFSMKSRPGSSRFCAILGGVGPRIICGFVLQQLKVKGKEDFVASATEREDLKES